jgi:hypothetical protein
MLNLEENIIFFLDRKIFKQKDENFFQNTADEFLTNFDWKVSVLIRLIKYFEKNEKP